MANPRLHRGTYPRRAAIVRRRAYADPSTTCRRCGLTYDEAVRKWGKKAAAWHAGHVVEHPRSALAPEHARCNLKAGLMLGQRRKRDRQTRVSPNA